MGKSSDSCAALTMVFKSYDFLTKWVDYYGGEFGQRNLYIIGHGFDERHREIAKDCNLIVVPRVFGENFNSSKSRILSKFMQGLLEFHNSVILGDTDEYVIVDPRLGTTLREYLIALPGKIIGAPIGLNALPNGSSNFDWSSPMLAQIGALALSSEYSKPCVFKRSAIISRGGHGIIGGKFDLLSDLYLIHAKYADLKVAKACADDWEADRLALLAKHRGEKIPMLSLARQRGWEEGCLNELAGWSQVMTYHGDDPLIVSADLLRDVGLAQNRERGYRFRYLRRRAIKFEVPSWIKNSV